MRYWREWLLPIGTGAVLLVLMVVVTVTTIGDIADAKPNRLSCRDTVSYATGQALIKNDGWKGDPTDGREALYGPRGTCVLIAV